MLTSAALFHLKKSDLSKHTRNLSPASRTILLSGPAGKLFLKCLFEFANSSSLAFYIIGCIYLFFVYSEFYQQLLAKALAHHFEAKLLLLDATDFSQKVSGKVMEFPLLVFLLKQRLSILYLVLIL